MKNAIYILALVALSTACKNDGKHPNPPKNDGVAEYALSLDTAVSYTQRYVSFMQNTFNDPTPIKGYTVRAVDLLEAMGMPLNNLNQATYQNVRVYLGMDAANKFRLLLTPVDGADLTAGEIGSDVILSGDYTSGSDASLTPVENGRYVMDFTSPCPNQCPSKSPLNVDF